MKGPLEKRHVSKCLRKPGRCGIALGPAASLGQQDDRKIGPRRLPVQKVCQWSEVGISYRFVRDDTKVGPADYRVAKRWQIAADLAGNTCFLEDLCRHLCIASIRC